MIVVNLKSIHYNVHSICCFSSVLPLDPNLY